MLMPDGREATIKDLVASLKQNEVFAMAFKARNVSGSGAVEGAAAGTENPWAPGTRNITKQMELINSNPQLASKMAALYGFKV